MVLVSSLAMAEDVRIQEQAAMRRRGKLSGAGYLRIGAAFVLCLAAGLVLGCEGGVENQQVAVSGDRHEAVASASLQPLTGENKAEAEELLAHTALFRRSEIHPEWEKWTADDFKLLGKAVLGYSMEWRFGAEDVPLEGVSYVWSKDSSSMLMFYLGTDDRVLRLYRNGYVARAVAETAVADRSLRAALTAKEALNKAKEYVASVVGEFPKDLVAVEVTYCAEVEAPGFAGDVGLWTVKFDRYQDTIPYFWEGIEVSFSEHHGVAEYRNLCFGRWGGQVRVSPEAAVATAAKQNVESEIRSRDTYSAVSTDDLLLRRPPCIREGHPYLMHVVKGHPTDVHAVWAVEFPYGWVRAESLSSCPEWESVRAFVDAETGEFLAFDE